MDVQIFNTFKSSKGNEFFYTVSSDKCLYENGDYRIYKKGFKSYIYTYKGVAFNELTGLNTKHLDRVAERKRPEGEYSPLHFLYDRALESIAKAEKIYTSL